MVNLRKGTRFFSLLICLLLISTLVLTPVTNADSAQIGGVPLFSQQPYSNLCWASVSSMIISFFKHDLTDRKVEIAQSVYGKTNFNKAASASIMRDCIYNYCGFRGTIGFSLPMIEVKYQIEHNVPAGVIITYTQGSSHAMCLVGWTDQSYPSRSPLLHIIDPMDGNLHKYYYTDFRSNSSYVWTNSISFK